MLFTLNKTSFRKMSLAGQMVLTFEEIQHFIPNVKRYFDNNIPVFVKGTGNFKTGIIISHLDVTRDEYTSLVRDPAVGLAELGFVSNGKWRFGMACQRFGISDNMADKVFNVQLSKTLSGKAVTFNERSTTYVRDVEKRVFPNNTQTSTAPSNVPLSHFTPTKHVTTQKMPTNVAGRLPTDKNSIHYAVTVLNNFMRIHNNEVECVVVDNQINLHAVKRTRIV